MKILLVLVCTMLFVPALADICDPPRDLQLGAVDSGSGYVTFALFAPGKESVAVAGDFNNWSKTKDTLDVSSDGSIFWKKIRTGRGETRYKFVVDGDLWVGDPYARDIEWDSTGPNAVIDVGASQFRWNDSFWRSPNLNDLIIYETHVGDFSSEKTFNGMRKKLDYLKNMGINAIELCPVFEFPGDFSWGYNPVFFFAPETAYGTPDELKQLINDAHNKGIAVILDAVLNHVGGDHPYNQMWDYNKNPFMSTDGNPWGLPDLNHWSDATKRFVKDFVEFWLKEYHVDGYRFDYTRGIGYDGYSGCSYFTWVARQCKNNVYLIAEHLPQDPHLVLSTNMDSEWHDSFHDQMKANLREGDFEGGHYFNADATARAIHFAGDGFTDNAQVINYTESHDEERVIWEARTNWAIDYHLAIKKAKLGLATLMTASGVPMLFHGQEFAMDLRVRPKPGGYPEPVPLEWHRLKSYPGDQMYGVASSLIWLRKKHPALRLNNCEFVIKDNSRKLVGYKRWDNNGDIVVVVLNFGRDDQYVDVPTHYNGKWYEYAFNYEVESRDNKIYNQQIPGSGYKIFCLKKTW